MPIRFDKDSRIYSQDGRTITEAQAWEELGIRPDPPMPRLSHATTMRCLGASLRAFQPRRR
jgi:hypothetical protein